MKIDFSQCDESITSASDENGQEFLIEGYKIQIIISYEDASELLLNYDESNLDSPSATDSREIARILLGGLKKLQEG